MCTLASLRVLTDALPMPYIANKKVNISSSNLKDIRVSNKKKGHTAMKLSSKNSYERQLSASESSTFSNLSVVTVK